MAGGITTPELVAAVSEAGGIGSFGFAYSKPNVIDRDITSVRKLTSGPINANFFVFSKPEVPRQEDFRFAIDALNNLPLDFQMPYEEFHEPYFPSLNEQLEPVWIHKPQILTFHFGLPPKLILEKAQNLGIIVGITATNLLEAEQIQKFGADFIIAQGIEAGGHRGTFEALPKTDEKLTTFDLAEQLNDQIRLPFVSAGGIMNPADISKCLSLGAAGVQMGTAFLCCDEAGTGSDYKDYLLNKKNRKTVYTKGFSGRWAQSIQNEFTILIEGQPILPFPLQNTLTSKLRKEATRLSNAEYQSLWAGVGFKQVKNTSVEKLIFKLKTGFKSQK